MIIVLRYYRGAGERSELSPCGVGPGAGLPRLKSQLGGLGKVLDLSELRFLLCGMRQ